MITGDLSGPHEPAWPKPQAPRSRPSSACCGGCAGPPSPIFLGRSSLPPPKLTKTTSYRRLCQAYSCVRVSDETRNSPSALDRFARARDDDIGWITAHHAQTYEKHAALSKLQWRARAPARQRSSLIDSRNALTAMQPWWALRRRLQFSPSGARVLAVLARGALVRRTIKVAKNVASHNRSGYGELKLNGSRRSPTDLARGQVPDAALGSRFGRTQVAIGVIWNLEVRKCSDRS
jgi:hypothetical protein